MDICHEVPMGHVYDPTNPALIQSLIGEAEAVTVPQTPIMDSRLNWTHRIDMQTVWAKVTWAKIKPNLC
jgi:hypothetical protein